MTLLLITIETEKYYYFFVKWGPEGKAFRIIFLCMCVRA